MSAETSQGAPVEALVEEGVVAKNALVDAVDAYKNWLERAEGVVGQQEGDAAEPTPDLRALQDLITYSPSIDGNQVIL